MTTIQIPNATIDKITTLQDKCLKIVLVTRELSYGEMCTLFSQYQQEATVELEIDRDLTKTPSQRLRSRLFVYYKETKKTEKGFNSWYADALDQIGNSYLEKLNK